MTKREFTAIVLKLTGVYILVRYLGFLPMVLSPLTVIISEPDALNVWFVGLASTVPSLLYLAACIFIVIKSEKVAARLIPEDGEFRIGFSLSREDVLTLAFCCIGLVILVGSIPQLVQTFSSVALAKVATEQSARPWGVYARVAGNLVQAIIGLSLFLQARGMSGLWHKLRSYR